MNKTEIHILVLKKTLSVSETSKKSYNFLNKLLLEKNIENISIKRNLYRKPFLKGNEIYFNISHTENLICIAMSQFEVGVDIESKERKISNLLLKKYSYSDCESFIRAWTRYEAYVKLKGTGFNGLPRDLGINEEVFLKTQYLNLSHKTYLISIASFEKEEIEFSVYYE